MKNEDLYEDVVLTFCNGKEIGIVEIAKYEKSRLPDVIVWENQAFIATQEHEKKSGYPIYEQRLTATSSTTFVNAAKKWDEREQKNI